MSGIFGVICPEGEPVSRAVLDEMAGVMSRRGPDGMDTWSAGRVALGHLRFDTTPESRGDTQPCLDADRRYAITADARLDNRAELRRLLAPSRPLAEDAPDSRLILAAYREWGDACVARLLGDFAFAVWDARKARLFCARDHLGLRPFHYLRCGRRLAFASSARALRGAGNGPAAINEDRLADFLVQGLEGASRTDTCFEGIRRLPPAHTAVLDRDGLSLSRYWHPDPGRVLRLGSQGEYLEAFREVFERAVRDRLRCQAPVASMLSGGLDSSTVVGVAVKLSGARNGRGFDTFSGLAEDPENCIESGFIRRVIRHGGLNPTCIPPGEAGSGTDRVSRIMERMEEPWDSMLTLATRLYLQAADRGHLAMLDGVDGDLVASLPGSYPAALARRLRMFTSWREYRLQRRNYYRSEASIAGYLRMLRSALAPALTRDRLFGKPDGRVAERAVAESLISEELAARSRVIERLRECDDATRPGPRASLRQACIERVTAPYLTAAIERYERVAAACGMEHRKPFLDRRVVEFCIGLPWDQKFRDGWSKYIVRKLAETVLPGEVAWRRGWEHVGWSHTEARLRSNLRSIVKSLEQNRDALLEYVDPEKYRGILEGLRTSAPVVDERVRVLYALSAWLEHNA